MNHLSIIANSLVDGIKFAISSGECGLISLRRSLELSSDIEDLQRESKLSGILTLLIDGIPYIMPVDLMQTGLSNGVRWYAIKVPANVDVRKYFSIAAVSQRESLRQKRR